MVIHFMECADIGGALDKGIRLIESGVVLRLPPHSKILPLVE